MCQACVKAKIESALQSIFSQYPPTDDYLIMILNDVQEHFGYIPVYAQELIAHHLHVSMAHVYGVITFYSRFSLKPKGKYIISVCMGTACFVKGSKTLMDGLCQKLNIKPGQTTPDGLFSIDEVRCVGACGLAPVFMVNDEVYGKADAAMVSTTIDAIRAKEKESAHAE